MRKSVAGGVGVAAALVMVFGSGSANANPYDPYSGQTYGDAVSAISSGGGTAVIATKEGSYLPLDQCTVTGSRNMNSKVMLDLNCNDTSALNGHPGNSVTTPQGKSVQDTQNSAKDINANFADATAAGVQSWCEKNLDNCAKFCQGAGQGLCSAEIMQFLGA